MLCPDPLNPFQIKEIIETGRLERIKYERTNEVVSINIFRGIYGVGKSLRALV